MRRIVLALALIGASSGGAGAQVAVGPPFRVNTTLTGYQFASSSAILPDGSFVVVWSSYLQDGSDNGLYTQRYAASGTRVGTEFRVNTYTTGSQGLADLAVLAGGGVVLTFLSDESPAGVRARLFDGVLAPQGPEFRVQSDLRYAGRPQVASDPRGGFVVAWQGSDGGGLGAFARRFDARGVAIGAEFQVNTYTADLQGEPSLAVAAAGELWVVWSSRGQDGSSYGVYGQRYDGGGQPVGGEFRVNSYTTDEQRQPQVASDGLGNVQVVWNSRGQDGSSFGVYGQRFDAAGVPRGGEFQVNVATTDYQSSPDVAADHAGHFVVSWATPYGVRARRYDAQGAPRGGEFLVSDPVTIPQIDQVVVSDGHGNILASWTNTLGPFDVFARRFGWILPSAVGVDTAAGSSSDGNGVFEACETVGMEPVWRNHSGATQAFAGAASSFTGPSGATYVLQDATAVYGTVADGAAGACASAADCYALGIPCPSARPALHWDATLVEEITPVALGQSAAWPVHVGESFTDLPRTNVHYRFVETLLHRGITGGCGAGAYCPGEATTRGQIAVFVLAGREGSAWAPPPCGAVPAFPDVPVSSPFCAWIEELARRGVVAGCGGGSFCPGDSATRAQMAVFVMRTLDPALDPPACTTPVFDDVPASSLFCPWIEELARRGVVAGCTSGSYCPLDPVSRDQMAVFIAATFGLSLYGP